MSPKNSDTIDPLFKRLLDAYDLPQNKWAGFFGISTATLTSWRKGDENIRKPEHKDLIKLLLKVQKSKRDEVLQEIQRSGKEPFLDVLRAISLLSVPSRLGLTSLLGGAAITALLGVSAYAVFKNLLSDDSNESDKDDTEEKNSKKSA